MQNKFYELSAANKLNIYVEYGDLITLRNNARIDDFKLAIETYYSDYVVPDMATKKKTK